MALLHFFVVKVPFAHPPAVQHTYTVLLPTPPPVGCWIVEWGGWIMWVWDSQKACHGLSLCDGWLGGWTGLFCMKREGSRGKNRGLLNEACHPKPPLCSKLLHQPFIHSFIISALLLPCSPSTLPTHSPLFGGFVGPYSLALSHPWISSPPPFCCHPYFSLFYPT